MTEQSSKTFTETGVSFARPIDARTRRAVERLKHRGVITEVMSREHGPSFTLDSAARRTNDVEADFNALVKAELAAMDATEPTPPGEAPVSALGPRRSPDRSEAIARVRALQSRMREKRPSLPHGL